MAKGDKGKYSDKQKRQAEHIEDGYEKRGVGKNEAERRAWATVNKDSGGGKKSGSGRRKSVAHTAAKKGGELGGKATKLSRGKKKTATKKSSTKKASKKKGVKKKVTKKKRSSKKSKKSS